MKAKLLKISLIFFILAGVVLYVTWDDIYFSFLEPTDIYGGGYDFVKEGKGGHIETTLTACLDSAGTITTKKKNRGITVSTSNEYYYIIPVYDKEGTQYFVCAAVSDNKKDEYDKLADATWDYIEGKTESIEHPGLKFSGTVKKMDNKIYNYTKDWFKEAQWFDNDKDIDKYVLPLYLKPLYFESRNFLLILVAVFSIIGLIPIIIVARYSHRGR